MREQCVRYIIETKLCTVIRKTNLVYLKQIIKNLFCCSLKVNTSESQPCN